MSVKADVATLKTDVATLKSDVATLKEEMAAVRADLAAHRNETKTEFRVINARLDEQRATLNALIPTRIAAVPPAA